MMNKTTILPAASQQEKDYEIAVERLIVEVERTRQDMAESQLRIERLRGETRGMLVEVQQVLQKLSGA